MGSHFGHLRTLVLIALACTNIHSHKPPEFRPPPCKGQIYIPQDVIGGFRCISHGLPFLTFSPLPTHSLTCSCPLMLLFCSFISSNCTLRSSCDPRLTPLPPLLLTLLPPYWGVDWFRLDVPMKSGLSSPRLPLCCLVLEISMATADEAVWRTYSWKENDTMFNCILCCD